MNNIDAMGWLKNNGYPERLPSIPIDHLATILERYSNQFKAEQKQLINEDIEQILDDLESYFNNRSDADWDYETSRFIPNKDMRLLSEVQKLKEYFGNLE